MNFVNPDPELFIDPDPELFVSYPDPGKSKKKQIIKTFRIRHTDNNNFTSFVLKFYRIRLDSELFPGSGNLKFESGINQSEFTTRI